MKYFPPNLLLFQTNEISLTKSPAVSIEKSPTETSVITNKISLIELDDLYIECLEGLVKERNNLYQKIIEKK
ncbi:hypothetical protein F8M41_000323 [Gigaspora margarita]|uniref:Uncharacterized protein n=1 Tax=Gigaspora margarita TaxID=4874 RepID=A0A8H4A910_GIGMA|nr:hypothetical protein F8M41_000323 [Gigaspora margarita]